MPCERLSQGPTTWSTWGIESRMHRFHYFAASLAWLVDFNCGKARDRSSLAFAKLTHSWRIV